METIPTGHDVSVERQQSKIERCVGNTWVGLEDGEDAQQTCDNKQRLGANSDAQRTNVSSQMKPENAEEKFPKRVEHLDEKVPPKPDVRC